MKQNLSHEDIIRLLKVEKEFLKDEFGVLDIRLWGLSFRKLSRGRME